MKPIEGITPDMMWTALIVLIGAASIYILYGKVQETYRKQKEYKRIKSDPGDKLADEISKKVTVMMEQKFAETDKKLANDKALLDAHTRQIAAMEKRQDSMENGMKAQCRGVLALLNHELHNGNADEMEKAQAGMNDYLIEK